MLEHFIQNHHPDLSMATLNSASQFELPTAATGQRDHAGSHAERRIATVVGCAGSVVAAGLGYVIESNATGSTAGFHGALFCALVFVAIYRSLREHGL